MCFLDKLTVWDPNFPSETFLGVVAGWMMGKDKFKSS